MTGSGRWSAVDLHDLFLEAAETERWLPTTHQGTRTTWWPTVPAVIAEVPRSSADSTAEVVLTPTPEQVDRYHLAISLSSDLADDDRRLVWAVAFSAVRRARGPQWRRLGRMMQLDRRTVESRYVAALVKLSLRIRKADLVG